jgi:hypothetical protein
MAGDLEHECFRAAIVEVKHQVNRRGR